MANLDKNGKPIAIPKPEKKEKSRAKSQKPSKTVGTFIKDELSSKALEANNIADKLDRRQQNNINRNFGKSVEREVARLTGGTRVPMSGAIKNSVHNLEGDVSVRSRDEKRVLALIECKGTSGITPKGDKVFSLKFSVLEQARKEAELQHAMPMVWIHPKGENYSKDWIVIPSELGLEIIDILKDRYDVEVADYDAEDLGSDR